MLLTFSGFSGHNPIISAGKSMKITADGKRMYQGGRGDKGRELSLEVVRLSPEREEALKDVSGTGTSVLKRLWET